MRERYRVIARVEKTHGRRGEVVTVPVHGLPLLVREGLEVAVVPPQLKGSRWHTVTETADDGRAGQLVSLSGISKIGEADELVGRYLLAKRSDLPDDLELRDAQRLVGRQVADEGNGLVGTIDEVMVGPANDVWVISFDGIGEVLLPVIGQVVSEVPREGTITVDATGFIDEEGGSR